MPHAALTANGDPFTSNFFTHGSRGVSMTYPSGDVIHYASGTTNSLNDLITRLDSMTQSGTTLESYKYTGLSTVTERDHPQSQLNLTYNGTANGDAGDLVSGLDRFDQVIDEDRRYTGISASDSNGNVTTDDHGQQLVYDAWNRLVEIKDSDGYLIQAYVYDGIGRRTSKTDGIITTDSYYMGTQVIEDRTGVTTGLGAATGSNGTARAHYVWSPAYVNAMILRDRDTDANGSLDERLYATQDANYNTTSLINTSGTVQEYMQYGAYGNVSYLTSSWGASTDAKGWTYTYQGMNYDADSGLIYANARYLSISMMTWISADPLGYVDGASRYTLEGGNPINRRDPFGLEGTTPSTTQPAVSVKSSETQTIGPSSDSTAYALTFQVGSPGPDQFVLSLNGTATNNHISHETSLSFSTTATVPVTNQLSLNATGGYDPAKGTNAALGGTVFLSKDFQFTFQAGDTNSTKGANSFQGAGSLKFQLQPGGNGQPSLSFTPQIKGTFNPGDNSSSISPSLRFDEKISDSFSVFFTLGGTCSNGPSPKNRDFTGTFGVGAAIKANVNGFKFEFDPTFQMNSSTKESKDNIMFGAALVFPF